MRMLSIAIPTIRMREKGRKQESHANMFHHIFGLMVCIMYVNASINRIDSTMYAILCWLIKAHEWDVEQRAFAIPIHYNRSQIGAIKQRIRRGEHFLGQIFTSFTFYQPRVCVLARGMKQESTYFAVMAPKRCHIRIPLKKLVSSFIRITVCMHVRVYRFPFYMNTNSFLQSFFLCFHGILVSTQNMRPSRESQRMRRYHSNTNCG